MFKYKRIKLEPVADSSSDVSDTESVYSIQGRETEFARDTSDTSDHFEYEVRDKPDSQNILLSSTDESELQDIAELGAVVASLVHEDNNFDVAIEADTSEENATSPTSNSDVDPELPRSDYLDFQHCLICNTEDKDISYPYCKVCFMSKKDFFPPRPEKKKKKISDLRQSIVKKTITSSLSDGGKSSSADSGSKFSSQESGFDEGSYKSEDTTLCKICCVRKMNGVFVHGSSGHMHSCFRCAKKTWKSIRVCPICRKKCRDVIKLYMSIDKL